MSQPIVTCDDLKQLMDGRDGRFIVAMIVIGQEGSGTTQFTTYGKTADDKIEAKKWADWMSDQVFEGDKPEETVIEPYVRDAAEVKQQRDELLAAIQRLRKAIQDEIGVNPEYPEIEVDHAVAEADRAIAKAKGGVE